MKIDEFLARLQGVEGDGRGGWMACCPAHDDHNPSMHVNVGRDGRILVKCFAGCSAEEIVGALGLKKSDLMADEGKARGARRANGTRQGHAEETRGWRARLQDGEKPEARASGTGQGESAPTGRGATKLATEARSAGPGVLPGVAAPTFAARGKRRPSKHVCYYTYKREDGAAVFRVERRAYTDAKGGKTFVQQSPDPSARGGWVFGVEKQGVEYIPYQLPLVVRAAREGKSVVILEGEKDVCTFVKRFKAAATCNPKGAGKWQAGWGKYFEGVPSVLIIADNDPATKVEKKTGEEKPFNVGQRHACDVEAKLRADGYEGRIRKAVMPDVAGRHVKDFTDWVEAMEAAGRTVDRAAFAAALEESGDWPVAWEFGAAAPGDLQRAQKEARVSASPSAAAAPAPSASAMPGEGGAGAEKLKDGRDGMGEAGRYGRPCPRSPLKERGWFQVDFQIDPGRIARFNVWRDELEFEGWQKSENAENFGEFVQMANYSPIKCPASRMVSMAKGCIDAFAKDFKLANPQRTELTCSLALAWLRARGKFFADIDNPMYSTSLYFDSVQGVLYNIQSNEFQSFLATETNVSRENKVFKFMMALIEDLTMTKDETPRIRPSKEWERVGGAIYVSNGDSRMYKVTANRVEDVVNGTDGVVFLRGSTLMPFRLLDGPGLDPFVHSMLFRYASLEKDTDVMNCRLWFLNLFMCDQNKPILLINGPRGSGKTFLLQGMKQFLGIRTNGQLDDSYNKMDKSDKGAENFWIIIDKGRFEIFDNFDTKIGWADNDFQVASTGGTHKTRELYKTDVLVTLYARAFFALTSNNAVFTSEGGGLPDRIIKVGTVGRPKVSKGPAQLKADNMAHREEYMTFVLRTLAAALADKGAVDENINRRHPEFAEFSVRCGRAMGCEAEAVRALATAEIEKSVLPLMNDMIAKEIVAVLLDQKTAGDVSFTAGEMSEMIIGRLDADDVDEKTKAIYGARRIGKAIKKFEADFSTLFSYSTRMLEGKTRYEFKGLTARGESVVGSLRGGLVGFCGSFPESPTGARGAGDFAQNGVANAPNAPHARALAQTLPLTCKEDGNRDIAEGDEDEEGLDDLFF